MAHISGVYVTVVLSILLRLTSSHAEGNQTSNHCWTQNDTNNNL